MFLPGTLFREAPDLNAPTRVRKAVFPVAGLIYDTLKRVPAEEEQLEVEGLRIIIKKMKGPKIVLAKVLKLD